MHAGEPGPAVALVGAVLVLADAVHAQAARLGALVHVDLAVGAAPPLGAAAGEEGGAPALGAALPRVGDADAVVPAGPVLARVRRRLPLAQAAAEPLRALAAEALLRVRVAQAAPAVPAPGPRVARVRGLAGGAGVARRAETGRRGG